MKGKNREDWIAKREAELLPVPYFYVVFTLPDTLNQLAMYQPKAVYDSLFEAAWKTVYCFTKDPKHLGAKDGMNDRHPPYLGPTIIPSSTSELYRCGRWTDSSRWNIGRKVEDC